MTAGPPPGGPAVGSLVVGPSQRIGVRAQEEMSGVLDEGREVRDEGRPVGDEGGDVRDDEAAPTPVAVGAA
jgi:hypothetical protein